MSNYNKVLLMGRLTRDPELRYTPQGTPVSEIGLAVNREYTVGTERRKETTFVDITLWRRQAEVVCQYLKKGQPIFIEGHLALDSWEGQDGQKRSRLRVIAENFQFLGGRQEGDSSRGFPADDLAPAEGGESSEPRRSYSSRPGGAGGGPPASGPAGVGAPSTSSVRDPSSRIPASAFSPVPTGEDGFPEEGAPLAEERPGKTGEGPMGLEDSDIPF
jgi:single-strand DNA-binding protein